MQSALVMWACNGVLAVGWIALVFAPIAHRWCWFIARTCAMLLALVWAAQVIWVFGTGVPSQLWGSGWPDAMQQSLPAGAMALTQFQAFNLFVASWQVEDGPRHKIPHVWLLPGLVATALSGPIGLIIHMAIRDAFKLKPRQDGGRAGFGCNAVFLPAGAGLLDRD
jgi:hypothetical protein